ncbi:L,D-transpeptidase [Nakamurella antarctica]|uniref:L,D-transpeptidase n=1 Tax=Nakamurella antarctica TaxID=1902245 RepID=UPI001EEFA2D5|nr:Ig-like domain-containing protein [Nakamurella antarctica]
MAAGTIKDFALTNPDGKAVAGTVSGDGATWTASEELGYGKVYTAAGSAVGADGVAVLIAGTYTTLTPASGTARTTMSPADGAVVGVATPVMITFGVKPLDRAAIEKGISITTTPAVEGAWAWIQHDGGLWALDYRPQNYWPSGTVVHVEANLYGTDFGNGYWGREDLTSDFTIGRNQVVIADVNSHELVVKRDGNVVATYEASFGRGGGENNDLTTRSGIHVVSEFFETKLMSNPRYGYTNIPEKWAVRISNNGEFIHSNPNSVDAQGTSNVTHGCVNLSIPDAKSYYDSALYGDPVEVSGTDVLLSPSDGDIFDWAVDWDYWKSLSGLNG